MSAGTSQCNESKANVHCEAAIRDAVVGRPPGRRRCYIAATQFAVFPRRSERRIATNSTALSKRRGVKYLQSRHLYK